MQLKSITPALVFVTSQLTRSVIATGCLIAFGMAVSNTALAQQVPQAQGNIVQIQPVQPQSLETPAQAQMPVQGTPVSRPGAMMDPAAIQNALAGNPETNPQAIANVYEQQFSQEQETERQRFAKKIAAKWKPTQDFALMPSENIVIPVARGLMNSIATNFTMLAARTSDENSILEIEKGYLYVTINSDQPVGIIMYEDGVQESQVSVTLWPIDVPASMVKLDVSLSDAMKEKAAQYRKDIELEEKQAQAAAEAPATANSEHTGRIIELLTPVAQGDLPRGFTMTNDIPAHLKTPCQVTIYQSAEQRLTGGRDVIDVVLMRNDSKRAYHIREEMCLADGVKAVSVFEKAYLQPGETAEVYILRDKTFAQDQARKNRRPRLGGQ